MVDATTDTPAGILDAAADEVRAHGIRRTTASDIARRAGVSRQTLYRYWPDVQALLGALVTRELAAVMPPPAPAGALAELVATFVETADRIRAMPLLQTLRSSDPELLARYVLERAGTSQRGIHAHVAAQVAHGQQAGWIRPGPPAQIGATVLLIGQSAVLSAPIVADWLDPAAWRDELAVALTGCLRAAA